MTSSEQIRDIVIVITNNFKDIEISGLKIQKLAKALCNRFAGREPTDTKYEISIAIVDDNEICRLNKQFLNSNATTDCLSFDLSGDEKGLKIFDLVVNGEMAVRQANQRGHSSEAELALYITHGLLHNLGFDDSEKSRARKMHETEDEILQEFGYGLVYNKDIRPKEL
ncbi:MAG: rRNA maturation RNase YbeY [Planctomycetota bacterium]|jgi:probable rRNA maturation factor